MFTVSATVYSQDARVSITVRNETVNDVFAEIKAQTNYSFWFDVKDVDINRKVSIQAENETVKAVLSAILKGQGLSFKLKGNHIIISKDEFQNMSAGVGVLQENKKNIRHDQR
ncbi:MAG: STN domain-containing protein [Parabacteroides sp.]|nr:STN domain-containing protein [Parabacteroides sp.]